MAIETISGVLVAPRHDTIPRGEAFVDPAHLALHGYLSRFTGKTRDSYRYHLKFFFRFCAGQGVPVLEMTRPQLETYLRYLDEVEGKAPATIAGRAVVMTGFYETAEIDGLIDRNPMRHVGRPKVDKDSPRAYLSRFETMRLLEAARQDGPMSHALIAVLLNNGLRISECLSICIDAIQMIEGHYCTVIVGKGGRSDLVPFTPATWWALSEAIATRTFGPVLLSRWGTPMNRHAAARILRRLSADVGIDKNITPHSLRHSAATLALDAGVPFRDVQNFLRHDDPKSTRRYDRNRQTLAKNATHVLSSYIAGAG